MSPQGSLQTAGRQLNIKIASDSNSNNTMTKSIIYTITQSMLITLQPKQCPKQGIFVSNKKIQCAVSHDILIQYEKYGYQIDCSENSNENKNSKQ